MVKGTTYIDQHTGEEDHEGDKINGDFRSSCGVDGRVHEAVPSLALDALKQKTQLRFDCWCLFCFETKRRSPCRAIAELEQECQTSLEADSAGYHIGFAGKANSRR